MCSESVGQYAVKRDKRTCKVLTIWTTTKSECARGLGRQVRHVGRPERPARSQKNLLAESASGSTHESADDRSRSGFHKLGHCCDARSPLLQSAAAHRRAFPWQSIG